MENSRFSQFVLAAATAASLSPLSVMAASSLAAGGGCSKGVGGTLPFDPSFNPSCNGANQAATSSPGATITANNSWTDPRAGTTISASWGDTAGFGVLHSSASAIASTASLGTGGPLALGIGGNGYAVSGDDIVFNAPGMAGRTATVVGTFHVDGTLSVGSSSTAGAASSTWSITAGVLSAANQWTGRGAASGALYDTYGSVSGNPTVNQDLGFSALVVFGQPYTLVLRLDTSAYAQAQPAGSPGSPEYALGVLSNASANFLNTASWGGFRSVMLADGTAVQDWSVASGSGVDYSQPVLASVPEPGTSLMLLSGLGLIGGVARIRGQRGASAADGSARS